MSDPINENFPQFSDIQAAANRIAGVAARTPLLESPLLNERLGCRLFVKAEVLQPTGSFKIRGAYNRISQLNGSDKAKGVVAVSSGNHAQGVAHAAALLGLPATVVMPEDAPQIKQDNTRSFGAEVVLYERASESREALARRMVEERGTVMVHPFNDRDIVAGQGTVGLELAEQAADTGVALDTVLAPCGGGGLVAGIVLALAETSPGTAIYSVEPAGFDDMARSLACGERVKNAPGGVSICEAILTPTPGSLTFPIAARRLAGGLVVDDNEAKAAMRAAFRYFRLVLEPGGAVALAAVLSGKVDCRDRAVAVVASGGNVDARQYRDILAQG